MTTDLEKDLGRALERRARDVTGSVDLAEVQASAHRLRRRSRQRWAAGLAAAAVLAVVVPASLVLTRGDEDALPANPSPTAPTTAPTTAPSTPGTPAGQDALSGLPAGSAPNWPYLHGDRVQLPGGDQARFPAAGGAVTAFASYKGGWLVADDDTARTTWYDAAGKAVLSGKGGAIRTSDDGTQVAFLLDGRIHLGGRSGMGEGDQSWPVPLGLDGLNGFVRDGLVLTVDLGDVRLLHGDASTSAVPALDVATTTSQSADLVAGLLPRDAGGVVDLASGKVLWRGPWRPLAFSPDGGLVAAVPWADNGDAGELALLDARTGAVVARSTLSGQRLYLRGTPVWEDDTHVLFVADSGPTPREAVVRLGTDTGLERATDVVRGGLTTTVSAPYVLAAGR